MSYLTCCYNEDSGQVYFLVESLGFTTTPPDRPLRITINTLRKLVLRTDHNTTLFMAMTGRRSLAHRYSLMTEIHLR